MSSSNRYERATRNQRYEICMQRRTGPTLHEAFAARSKNVRKVHSTVVSARTKAIAIKGRGARGGHTFVRIHFTPNGAFP